MKKFFTQLSGLKKTTRTWMIAAGLLTAGLAQAQVSSYTFSQSSGTYTPISGGTVLGVPSNDDTGFPALPIGFSFCYNGATYTTFGVNTNGWITMGSGAITNSYTALSSGTNNNVIAAFNFDIQGDATTGDLQYKVLGTSPNQTLVIQWTNYDAFSSASNGDTYNFQIRLSETTGTIEVVYGNFVKDATFRLPQVGLRGATSADFNNRSVSNGLQTWATSIAGTANTATCEVNNLGPLVPTSGQTYTWTAPAAPALPTSPSLTAVTATGMTVNWVDNSTNEANFIVQRSTDNITFTTVATIPSTSVATTLTPYSYTATGLFSGTLYYWRVFAANANCGTGFLPMQQSTLSGTMCGTYTVGPTGAYTSLTAAFAAVATNGVLCPLVFDLQAAYVSTVETFPLNIPALGNGPSNTITVRPELGAVNLSITSNATQTINFNGATYVRFDGRPGSVGTLRQLTIENTSVTGVAVNFVNDALGDGLNFCRVRGVNTSASAGVINFGAATVAGNNNHNITNCDIFDGATQPTNLIYASNATANTFNSGITISNNLFHDWYTTNVSGGAIQAFTGNTAWTISNNSFYQTATRTYTGAVNIFAVNLAPGSGSLAGGFVVTGNFFGGSAASCGGTPTTYTAAVAIRYLALQLTTGTGGANSIQGNTFRNYSFTTTSGATTTNGIWCAINTTGTNAANNIGNITPNVIGSNTANGQIVTSTTTTGGLTVGINNSASGIQNISNNQIGGITANSSGATISSSIVGIQTTSGAATTISGNTIGSTTLSSSFINAASTGTTGGQVTGILCSAFNSSLPGNVISNNTVMNLTNQYAGTSTVGYTRGIVTTSGINTITGNTINILSNLAPQIGTTTTASVQGICANSVSSGANQTISNNTVTNLANGSITANVQVIGIILNGTTLNQTLAFRNIVRGVASASTGAPVMHGMLIIGGTCRVYNNMVTVGVDGAGSSLTFGHEFNGITKNTSNRATVAFNTVWVGGTGVAVSTANTSAYRSLLNATATPADSVYSNIFSNTRSDATAGGNAHYAINISSTTNFLANGNNYYGNGTDFVFGTINAVNVTSLAAWVTATSQDANSFAVDPTFISSTNLHINNAAQSALESRAIPMNINTDIDNQVRPGPAASVNGGGTGPDIGADEFDGIPVNVDVGIQLLVAPAISGCHSATDSVRVRLKNYSTSTLNTGINTVVINASVTGPNPATFAPFTVPALIIPAGGTVDFTIATNYNMNAVGTYVFSASTSQALDVIGSNNAMANVSIVISGGTANVAPSPICLGSATTLTVSGQTNGGTIQWQSSPDNLTWTNIVGATTNGYSVTPTDTTFYRAVICGQHNSVSDTVFTVSVTPPTTIGATRCGAGSVTMSGSGTGTLSWYTTSTGGSPINTGNTYTTNVNNTTTFYVENTFTNIPTATTPATPTCYPTYSFACSSSDFINNVSTTGGITNISNLASGCNGIAPSNTTFFPTQIVTTTPGGTFNLSVQSGTTFGQGFRLWIDYNNDGDFADVGENVWASATSNTLVNTATITVPFSATAGPHRMRLMCRYATVPAATDYCLATASFGEVEEYNLMVGLTCGSVRTPVTATVTPAPAITLSSTNVNLCTGTPEPISVASSNATYSYTWAPATGLNVNVGDSVIANPATTTSYVVSAVDANSGCQITDTVVVNVNQTPNFTIAVDNDTVCAGTTVNMRAVLPPAIAQVTNSNIQNTSTSYPAPYGQFYGGARHQMLILASELSAAGMTAGFYNSLSFQVAATNASAALLNFEISIAPTNITTLTAGTWATGTFTSVYTAPTYTPAVGNNVHTFNTPYYWDGVSNLIVQTCFVNQTGPTTTTFTYNCSMRQASTSFLSTVWLNQDNVVTICSTPVNPFGSAFQRPNMAFGRSFATYAYSWTPAAAVVTPSNDSTAAVTTTSMYYTLTVTDTTSGCAKTDSIWVQVNPNPAPSFGPDTAICAGANLILDGTSGPYTYLWQDSTTNQTYTATTIGQYSVVTTDSLTGCFGTDTILMGLNPLPSFSLGADVAVCDGNTATFSGPSGAYNYQWQDASTGITLTLNATDSVMLTVTDAVTGCAAMDTALFTVNPNPVVTLGADTVLCANNAPITLSAPAGPYNYQWQDNSTNQTFIATTSGNEFVTVTDSVTGCFSSDTIVVTINANPAFSLGNDTTFCSANGPITLNGPVGPYNYSWQDASTNSTFTTNTSGTYILVTTDSVTGCAGTDTMIVNVPTTPSFSINDTTTCSASVVLTAPAGPYNYLWNTGDTTQTIVANAPGGNYYVTLTDSTSGCASSDSLIAAINLPPTVTFAIAQSTICTTDASLTLSGSPAGGTFSGPGVSGSTFNPAIAGVGTHTVTYNYTDPNGCSGTATDLIIVDPCVGINEPFVAAGMNVFPNPNAGTFTLTINSDLGDAVIDVMNVTGQIVYSEQASDVKTGFVKQIDMSTHANGIYYLRVSANGQLYMQRVVKQD